MEYYKTSTLKHYGILGMHWGVRNGPPYPLTSKQKSASERKRTPSKGAIVKKKGTGSFRTRYADMPSKQPRDVSSMTDEELKAFNNRAAQEKLYEKNTTPQPDKKALSNADAVTQLANATRMMSDNMQRAADNEYKNAVSRKKAEIDLSNVSDEDLRKAVNRMNLERQYRDLTPVEIESGEEKFKQAMEVIGPVVSTAASVALIASVIYKIVK